MHVRRASAHSASSASISVGDSGLHSSSLRKSSIPGSDSAIAAVNFASRSPSRRVVGDQAWSPTCERDAQPQVVRATGPRATLSKPISQRSRFGVHRTATDVACGDPLHPDGLPDAGRARIPDRMRLELPVLLAARLGEIVRIVLGADHDLDGVAASRMMAWMSTLNGV